MKKLYSEKQYREYTKLMEKMANIDDIIEGANIHIKIQEWLADNHISEETEAQMDMRMEQEFNDEINGVEKKECEIIEFPQ